MPTVLDDAPGGAAQLLPQWAMRELTLRLPCTEVLSVNTKAFPTTPEHVAILDKGMEADVDAARRGGLIRGLVMPQACVSEYDRHHYDTIDGAGGEHRVLRAPAQRLLILDRQLAIVEAGIEEHVLLIRAPGAVAAMHAGFEAMWRDSLARRPSAQPGDDDRLLDLVTEGRTDAAAARALGVSERTVRRRLTALMEGHGARSRYELGLKIAASGQPD